MKRILLGLLLALLATTVLAQSAIIRGEESAGVYQNLKSTSGVLQVIATQSSADPCASPGVVKNSIPVAITSATTTQLVALVSAQTVFVCNFTLTISQVITTANTIKFVYGTGSACGTGTTDITGLFGGGGITAAAPIVIMGGGNTLFKTIAGNALCVTTAIGASGNFQGVVTYVQQ